MMVRAPAIAAVTLLCALPLTGGCVQQDRYDQMLMANRSLQEQIVSLQDERDGYRTSLEDAQKQSDQYSTELATLQSKYDTLEEEFASLTNMSDEYLQRIIGLEMGPLPKDVESALTQLALGYPDLITFDPKQGMMRFASDVTFDLGSTALKQDAATTITALADILNTTTAESFEVRIVGHTDNVPIGQPSTRQQHPTNVHLSVHRAISVRKALMDAGVDPVRLQVAGYGEFRPIVPNGTRGAAENRRVEIFLVPMDRMAAARDTKTEAAAIDEPMK